MNIKKLIVFLKETGFIFPGSEIYGGLANSWDYGHLGIEFKNNIKNLWWDEFIKQELNIVGVDSSIILNSKVWKSSGHLTNFSDPLTDCKHCQTRYQVNNLILEHTKDETNIENLSFVELEKLITILKIKCKKCGKNNFTNIRNFNLMFKTNVGVLNDSKDDVYLRPEIAQGIFLNFKNIQKSANLKLPFGIGQIGKSFRNEITPGNFIFRTKEFEQMELEFFTIESDSNYWYKYYQKKIINFLVKYGLKSENLVLRNHKSEELSHYSIATCDIEYKFPFGQKELWGIANRGNFDLTNHQKESKTDLSFMDLATNSKIIPHVIEPSVGVERLMLALLIDAFQVEEDRIILKLHPRLAPYKVAVLPLIKKIHSIKAKEIFHLLALKFNCTYLENQKIGKRYKKQDEIGTPFAVTIDDETVSNNIVTIRNRDDKQQISLPLNKVIKYLETKIYG